MSSIRNVSHDTGPCSETTTEGDVPRRRSADLLQGGKRLIIEHRGDAYCLRLTRNEKLILTKL